jgi:hypothetical protein
VQCGISPTFPRCLLPPSSGQWWVQQERLKCRRSNPEGNHPHTEYFCFCLRQLGFNRNRPIIMGFNRNRPIIMEGNVNIYALRSSPSYYYVWVPTSKFGTVFNFRDRLHSGCSDAAITHFIGFYCPGEQTPLVIRAFEDHIIFGKTVSEPFTYFAVVHCFPILFFWVKAPCGLIDISQSFGEECCFHLQGWSGETGLGRAIYIEWQEGKSEGTDQCDRDCARPMMRLQAGFSRGERSTGWLLPNSPHSAWTEKNIIKIVTTVKALNFT